MPSTVDTHKKIETVDTHQSWTSTIVREPSIGSKSHRLAFEEKKVPNMDVCRGRGIVHG